MSIQVYYEATPNPQSMKFYTTEFIANETVSIPDHTKAARSPLAQKLFGFPWMDGVLIGPNFVTVTKQDWVDWQTLAEPLSELIREHLEMKLPVLVDIEDSLSPDLRGDILDSDSEEIKQIKTILNTEIRPAVAMDGGDIQFHKYEDQIVYLHMQGACAGCPSSMMTLKDGIEVRLKEHMPQIKEVVAI
ncbi:MAG: NifU family protein [Bdellovibrionales bacterium]|nr:NifU family protein [Bdellovibrionales bacterium]